MSATPGDPSVLERHPSGPWDDPSTGLHFACARCGGPINRPGGLLFGPPDENGMTRKTHICANCWPAVEAYATASGQESAR